MVSKGALQPRTWIVWVKAYLCVNRKRMCLLLLLDNVKMPY